MEGSVNFPQRHIFRSSLEGEVASEFAEKMVSFHDLYIDDLLLTGIKSEEGIAGPSLNKDSSFPSSFSLALLDDLSSSFPLIRVDHIFEDSPNVSCCIFYVNSFEEIEGFYMTQCIFGWEGSKKSCYQVWSFNKDGNLMTLNNHWLK